MSRANPLGAGLFRLCLTGVVCLSLATSLWAQDSKSQRIPYQPDPVTSPQTSQSAGIQVPKGPAAFGAIQQPRILKTTDGFTPVVGDDPDFAPMEEVNTKNSQGEIISTQVIRKGNPYVLSFIGGDYAPERGIDPRLLGLAKTNPNGFTYGYVMLRGRMADDKKVAALKQLGIKILGVHTYQSYIARIPLAQLPQIGALPFVHWVGFAQPDQKLEPRLLKSIKNNPRTQRYQVDISIFDSDIGKDTIRKQIGDNGGNKEALIAATEVTIPNGPKQKKLESLGFEFEYYTDIGNVYIFEGWATAEQILKMRDLGFVSYIEKKQVHGLNHDQTVAMTGQDRVRGFYSGSSVTLGIIDTGVTHAGGGTGYVTHKDLNKIMIGWSNVSGQSAYHDGYGHGSHVAGTMIGEGVADKRYKGMAPGVGKTFTTRFFVGRYFDDLGKPKGNVASLYNRMKSPYTFGSQTSPRPRAINNSWGADAVTTRWTGTESGARTLDTYIYNYNQCYVFSAGNKGVGVGSPGSAKNALTVGSVNDFWSSTVKPGDLSSFSRYYTQDGRKKPEVVMPGSVVTSVRTRTTSLYTNKSGTSMAAPHMTGAIASLVQKFSAFNYRPWRIKAHAMAAATWQGNPGGSSGWFGTSGYGLVDTYKMSNASSRYSWGESGNATALTSSGKYFYTDLLVPSNLTNAKLVMSFIEQAAGSGATKARVCDVRVYIDVAPFTAGGNTGEFSIVSSSVTTLSKAGASFANSIKGKMVRIKIYGQSIPSGYKPKVGWTLFYYNKPTTGKPVLNAYAATPKVKPNTQFWWFATLTAGANSPEFSNARIYPSFSSLFPIQYMYRNTLDKTPIGQFYYPTASYPSNPYPSLVGTTYGGMTVGAGNYRWLGWRLKAPPTSGSYSLRNYATLDPLSTNSLTDTGLICVDGLAPNTVSGLTSTTHPAGAWRNSTSFFAKWTQPTDVGCAGISGLAYSLTTGSNTIPTIKNISGAATGKSLTIGNTTGVYFHVRAVDAVGNLSAATSHYGPIRVDTTKPVVTKVFIQNNNTYTKALNIAVSTVATDSYSGPKQMRFSSNGSTWAPWRPYTTAPQPFLLSSYGGNTSQGTKRVYVQVMDGAGNLSGVMSDSIIYDSVPPTISKVLINSGANYTTSLVVKVSATGSGAAFMRYSFNGSTWSGLYSYTAADRTWNASSLGGNTNQGTKIAYVQLRDLAGNLSVIKTDSILYDSIPPVLSSVSINNNATWTKSSLVGVKASGTGATFMQYSFNNSTWSGLFSYTSSTRTLGLGSYGGSTSQGTKTVFVRLRDVAGNFSVVKADQIIYDSVAPLVTLVRINNGAAFTNSTTVGVQVLGSGSPAQVQYSFNNSTWSPWMSYTTGNRSLSLASYGGNTLEGIKTVYARLRDGATNVSSTRTDTIIYDKTAPVVTLVRINGGATYTSSTTVSVQVLGSGSPALVQYSFNGVTWSPWLSYTTGNRNLHVGSYGGNTSPGTKTVYARLRDGALNNSTTQSASIVYLRIPTISSMSGTTWTVIHDNRITLNGFGFFNVNRAYVGTNLITSTSPEDWHKGYMRILSDSKMEVYPPQNLAPGTYTCYVRNAGYKSANFGGRVVLNTASKTGVPTLLKSGKTLHVYTARGPKPATTVSVLTFSVSPKPLVIPGLISLGHGGNTTTFIDPSFTIITPGQIHNAVTRTAHWAFPTPPGKIAGNIYWQSVMFDAANPTKTPIPVSTTDVVKFYK